MSLHVHTKSCTICTISTPAPLLHTNSRHSHNLHNLRTPHTPAPTSFPPSPTSFPTAPTSFIPTPTPHLPDKAEPDRLVREGVRHASISSLVRSLLGIIAFQHLAAMSQRIKLSRYKYTTPAKVRSHPQMWLRKKQKLVVLLICHSSI